MMATFKPEKVKTTRYVLRRTGQFTVRTTGDYHCGTTEYLEVKYRFEAVCPVAGLDTRGFLFDQTRVQSWFESIRTTEHRDFRYRAVSEHHVPDRALAAALPEQQDLPGTPTGARSQGGMTARHKHTAVTDGTRSGFRFAFGRHFMKWLCIDLFCGLGGWAEGFMAEGFDVVGFDIERHNYGGMKYQAQLILQDVLTLHGAQFKDAACIVASPPCQKYSWLAMPWSRSTSEHSQAAKALRRKWETEGPDNRLFDACFRIQREASEAAGRHIPLIVENVRGAQEWVGRAAWSFGSFYLWGDVPALMPIQISKKGAGGGWFGDNGHAGHLARRMELERPGGPLDGQKTQGGSWFGPQQDRKARGLTDISGNSSRSNARKAASALIAKIPFELARHIADVYRPRI